jgi:hypothetical protein
MMKYVLFLSSVCLASTTFAENIYCQVSVNLEIQSKSTIQVSLDENISYAKIQSFQMKIKNLGFFKFEIEVYDSDEPARHYAKGTLRSSDDEIKWTLWRRDIIIETTCRLASEPQPEPASELTHVTRIESTLHKL